MVKRAIIRIDEELCNGCGECVPSCAEGAIQIIDGKAKLVADNLCDGLGACLNDCPTGALTIEEREADEFDEEAVARRTGQSPGVSGTAAHAPAPHAAPMAHHGGGCPGARTLQFGAAPAAGDGNAAAPVASELRQWPIQLHLVSPGAPYFQGADVLLAADCVPFSVGNFHQAFLRNKALAVACPKLDSGQETYVAKLAAMIDHARINTLTVMIMEVPCCSGLVALAQAAAQQASRKIPIKRVVVSLQGEVLREEWI